MHEGGSQVPFTDGGSEVRGEKPATSLRWGCPGEGQSPIRGCAGAPLEQGGGGGGGWLEGDSGSQWDRSPRSVQ